MSEAGMSLGVQAIIIFGTMLLFLIMGAEIFAAIGLGAMVGLMLFINQGPEHFARSMWNWVNSFTLTAVPLFIFMGAMLAHSGVIRLLFRGADKIINFLPGGMAASSLVASGVFGAISGSSIASVAAFGTSVLPEMERLGYKPSIAIGSVVMGGTLSVLIPPSVILIGYGAYMGLSIPRLFAAGLIPGIILMLLYIITVVIIAKVRPDLCPPKIKYSIKEKLGGFIDIAPALFIMTVTLGSIFGGILTPTEAAALGGFLSMLLALVSRTLNLTNVKESALTAVKVAAMLMPLIFIVKIMGYVFNYLGTTEALAAFMAGLPLGKYGILAVIFFIYILLGFIMEGISIMMLSLAFVAPILTMLGFNFIWFGVIMVVVNELGLVTPPFGLNLFALHAVVPKYSIFTIAWAAVPFYPAVLILLTLLVAFPKIVLWLPFLLF
jgi:tripartite ATP-independent transporter DctM subunit